MLLWAGWTVYADAPPLETLVKASYLYHFTQFVEWPDDAFIEETGNFNMCVVGARRFGRALDALRGEWVGGRRIEVQRFESISAAPAARCHLLFVGVDAWRREPGGRVPAARGLLPVGEAPGFLRREGIINMVEVDGRIRFEINQAAAKNAGLVISSRLLRPALER